MLISAHAGDSHDTLGTTATIKLDAQTTNGRMAVLEHTVPQHAGPPPHYHDHGDELFYVLEGTFEFILEDPDTWHHAGPGNIVNVPAGTLHTSRATSQTARLLSVYTPAGGEAFFREIEHIDRTDLDAVKTLAAQHGMSFPTPTTG
jgi:quercetin dioxygenase-like cupin family protein